MWVQLILKANAFKEHMSFRKKLWGQLPNNPQFLWGLFFCFACGSCQSSRCEFEPTICYSPAPHLIENLPSAFPALSVIERSEDWGKELFLGKSFAKDMDLYRALTCFKSALFLIPRTHPRRIEIEYDIFFSYYIANKYQEAIEAFESSCLIEAPETFPPLDDLLIALYDSYMKVDLTIRACRILGLIETLDTAKANQLKLETALIDADFPRIVEAATYSESNEAINEFLTIYHCEKKSISKAKMLNAILPGMGYLYVGQKKTALTSFLINALFIGAAYQLFDRGYIPAAIIVASLETGWYFGGINGAALEAKQYNENLYERIGRDTLTKERLFPILMLQKGF